MLRGFKAWNSCAALLAACFMAAPYPVTAAEKGPTVFAAASLKNALDAVAADWKKTSGTEPVISYAATSALAKQIERGAEANMFISADQAWMNYLAERNLIQPKSRFDLLSNQLVLIAPEESELPATGITAGFPLAEFLGDGRLAVAVVDAVPAGKYAKAALTSLGVWDQVEAKLAQAENVRAALRLVSRGEAPLGIVYASDAKADPGVKVLGVFPAASHEPIVYPAAQLAGASSPDADAFFAYLRTQQATARFEEHGFARASSPSP